MRLHILRSLWVLLLIGTFLLSACTTATSTPTAPGEEAAPTEAVEEPATEVGEMVEEEYPTVVVAMRETGNNLDGRFGTWIMSEIVSTITDTIITLDEDGNFQPGLAESWDFSDDGMRFTFHLKEGVTFHDGTEFNAEAFRDWFKGWLDGPSSYVAEPISEYIIEDPYTITLVSDWPYPSLIFELSTYFAGVHSPTATAQYGEDYGTAYAVGTGPFKLVEFVKDDHVTVERNPDYDWGPSWLEYQGPSKIGKITFKALPEDSVRVNEVLAGQAQIGLDIPPQFAAQLDEDSQLTLLPFNKMGAVFMAFNHERESWQDLKVRQAVAHAIDKEVIVENLWFGYAEPTYELLAPLFKASEGVAEAVGTYYDPAAATQLLTEAGWSDTDGDGVVDKDGVPLTATLISNTQSEFVRLSQAIQANLKDIGIDVEIQNFTDLETPEEAGEFDLVLQEWWWQDSGIIDWWFNPAYIPYPNFSRWSDPTTAEMMNNVFVVPTNFAEREEMYREINMLLTEQLAAVPILSPKNIQVINISVENWMWITYGPQQWAMTELVE